MGCLKLSYYTPKEELETSPLILVKELEKNSTKPKKRVSSYRFAFNGIERDDEWGGVGNSYDFGARIYDSRIARFLSVDPDYRKYPGWSPYLFAANSPVAFIDRDGRGPGPAVLKVNLEYVFTTAIKREAWRDVTELRKSLLSRQKNTKTTFNSITLLNEDQFIAAHDNLKDVFGNSINEYVTLDLFGHSIQVAVLGSRKNTTKQLKIVEIAFVWTELDLENNEGGGYIRLESKHGTVLELRTMNKEDFLTLKRGYYKSVNDKYCNIIAKDPELASWDEVMTASENMATYRDEMARYDEGTDAYNTIKMRYDEQLERYNTLLAKHQETYGDQTDKKEINPLDLLNQD